MRLTTFLLVAVSGVLLWPDPASAQIYAWRDAHGNLVLSDRKLVAEAQTYAVPNAPAIRSTRPLVSFAVSERFEPLVQQHASRLALRPDLVRAVIQVESGFNPRARSPKGAMGLMQLMPATAIEMGVHDPYNPDQSIRGGTTYLRLLIDRYKGNEELALAAYNAGAGAVDRYGYQIPPYRETREYVKKVGSIDAGGRLVAVHVTKRSVYKTIDVVNGREVPRYSSEKPAAGAFEIVAH